VPAAFLIVYATLIGLLVGSFANVAIHRWPSGGSVRSPSRSHCPLCDTELTLRDNLPVISWLVLRGRCRTCAQPIAKRYPIVESGTALLFALVAWQQQDTWALAAFLVLTWSLVVASAIDIEHQIIPNLLTYRLPFVLLALLVGAAVFEGQYDDLKRGLVFALVLPGGMLLISELFRLLRGKNGIGMGDIKLAVSLGLALGWLGGAEVVAFLYLSIVGAVVVALGLLVAGKAKLASRLPFGPYLALGTLAVLIGGDAVGDLVRSIFMV
jgi:leader peptidase (prepilin peptidase)/N-methyltransferase